MNNEELIKEFIRWVDAGRPDVYMRIGSGSWHRNNIPSWRENINYIVNDKHAELRMLQIDKPCTKFEWYSDLRDKWLEPKEPMWHLDCEYRVKQELEVDTKVIVWDENTSKFKRYFSHFEDGVMYCFNKGYTQWSNSDRITTVWDNWELADEK